MNSNNTARSLLLACAIGLAATGTSQGVILTYPTPGVPHVATYSFTAAGPGSITAYFAGHSAAFLSEIGLSINGAAPTGYFLPNHSTPLGTSAVLGTVTGGETLEFVLRVGSGSYFLNSNPTLNPTPGQNHIYSYAYGGGDHGIPAGTYVGFEDLLDLGDKDYDDHQFVFTGPGLSVPEGGSSMAVMGTAILSLGLIRRFMKK